MIYELICKCTVTVGKLKNKITTRDKWCKECKTKHQILVQSDIQSDGLCDIECRHLDGSGVCEVGGC